MPPLEGTQTVEMLGFRPPLNPGVKPTLKTKIAFHPGPDPIRFLWVSRNPLIRLDMTGTLAHFMFA